MKISLLKPPTSGILGLDMVTFAEPLGLECVAAALEQEGHECQIVDFRLDGFRRGMAKVRRFNPQIAGIQSTFTTERFRAILLARRLKAEFPDIVTCVGGHDASRDPEWFVEREVDIAVVGDGERVFPGLARAYEEKKDLTSVPGLVIASSAGPVRTEPVDGRPSLDALPPPARHLISEYASRYYMSFCRPLALIETARGCPYRCSFCSVWKFHEGSYREKSPERVLDELRAVRAPYVFITDDIFWIDPDRSTRLAGLIREAGISKHFFVQTRSDIVVRRPDLIEEWKSCGKVTVFLGFESLDDEGLQSVNKKNSAENNDRALKTLNELGVGYTPNFIIDPAWDREDFARLRDWITQTGAYSSGFSVLTPLPGTDLWDEVSPGLTTHDWELFDLEHAVLPTRLPLREFYEEYASLWRHALDVRNRIRGRAKSYAGLALALATGKTSITALRRGVRIGKVLGKPSTFLAAHRGSARRTTEARLKQAAKTPSKVEG